MSPDRKTAWCMRVCLSALQVCISTWDIRLHQPCDGRCSRVGVAAAASSTLLSLVFSALPLRLRAFDQAKVMFVRLATSVAISAVRNLACLGGEEILALSLKQAKDKRSMAQFKAMNWREKFTNIVGDYEREIYVWIGGSGERGGI